MVAGDVALDAADADGVPGPGVAVTAPVDPAVTVAVGIPEPTALAGGVVGPGPSVRTGCGVPGPADEPPSALHPAAAGTTTAHAVHSTRRRESATAQPRLSRPESPRNASPPTNRAAAVTACRPGSGSCPRPMRAIWVSYHSDSPASPATVGSV